MCGISGTFVAIHIALQQDLQGKLIDVRQIVRNLRFQRIGILSSPLIDLYMMISLSEIYRCWCPFYLGSSFAGFVDVGNSICLICQCW